METVTNKTLEKLKYDLVRAGLVAYETIEQAQEIANAQNINIGQVLINSGTLSEEAILKFLEAKLHIPYVNLDDYTIDEKCLKYIGANDAKKYHIIIYYILYFINQFRCIPMQEFSFNGRCYNYNNYI